MRRQLTRTLGILCLAAFVVTLAAWPLSYVYSTVLAVEGYGATADHGAYYVAGPMGFNGRTEAAVTRIDADFTIDEMLRLKPNRRIPIRVIASSTVGLVFVVAAWVPALVLAFPAWLTVRQWRRERRDVGRGFDVAVTA